MNNSKYPAIPPKRFSGNCPIVDKTGNPIAQLVDFWAWAHSDLLGNAERGTLGEYLIACALGVQNTTRVAWDKYDLKSPEGIAVEVKTSGYLQTWEQSELSKIIFSIPPTFGWDSKTNLYDSTQKRQADIYVFCVHKHQEQETANPLDLEQWDFYLLPTSVLDEKSKSQKTITLSTLIKLGAVKCEFSEIHKKLVELHQSSHK